MNNTIMWPIRYDMNRDECRKFLRCLELDAYGSMVSVLRAQGPLTNEKQRLLQELAKVLHISNERHRAEVRRAVNDEKLATIAEQLNGPNTGTDWTIEGRRAIPLLPRLKARSAFTTLANSLSLATATANERKPPIHEKADDLKADKNQSHMQLKLEETLCNTNDEVLPEKDNCSDTKLCSTKITESDKPEGIDQNTHQHILESIIMSEKRKTPSPLPAAPPNKVLVVSSHSLGVLNHGTTEKGALENRIHLSQTNTNSVQCQNVAVLPFSVGYVSSFVPDSKELVPQGNSSNHAFVQASKSVNTVSSICTTNTTKSKEKITMAQSKLSTKVTSTVLLSNSNSCDGINSVHTDTPDMQAQDSTLSYVPAQKTLNSGVASSNPSSTKRVSSAKTTINKAVTSNNSHHVMAVCPSTTVSSGPGPPGKQTTTGLTCKKMSATLNHQNTAKMGVTLSSNKSVNISHHPNAKLASKTNVIVIQKGHTKGVTLSHAGKEVLGKVILGGKNLCVASQHAPSSISVVPHHIALSNGDQAIAMLSTANSSYTESMKTNIKPGNTIVFNLRQDIMEKNKVLSQLLESSSALTSEPKSVIQNTNICSVKDQSNNDLHIVDKEQVVQNDTVITSVMDEKQHRKNKDIYTNASSYMTNSKDPTIYLGSKEILVRPSQLTNTQDDTISNINIEDTICSSEVDMFSTTFESRDIHFNNFRYLVEGNENHVLRDSESPILSISQIPDHNDV